MFGSLIGYADVGDGISSDRVIVLVSGKFVRLDSFFCCSVIKVDFNNNFLLSLKEYRL